MVKEEQTHCKWQGREEKKVGDISAMDQAHPFPWQYVQRPIAWGGFWAWAISLVFSRGQGLGPYSLPFSTPRTELSTHPISQYSQRLQVRGTISLWIGCLPWLMPSILHAWKVCLNLIFHQWPSVLWELGKMLSTHGGPSAERSLGVGEWGLVVEQSGAQPWAKSQGSRNKTSSSWILGVFIWQCQLKDKWVSWV